MLYALLAVPPAMTYALITLRSSAQEFISARVCLTIMTIAGDLIVVAGRRTGSLTGAILGAEFGALAARALLGVGAVGGAIAFALLCAVSPPRHAQLVVAEYRSYILTTGSCTANTP